MGGGDCPVATLPTLGADSWMGAARVPDPERWCTLDADDAGAISGLRSRQPGSSLAFVALPG